LRKLEEILDERFAYYEQDLAKKLKALEDKIPKRRANDDKKLEADIELHNRAEQNALENQKLEK